MAQTSRSHSTMVGFHLQPKLFPDVPSVDYVAFCWHHLDIRPEEHQSEHQWVILARRGGVPPTQPIRPEDLGRLVYYRSRYLLMPFEFHAIELQETYGSVHYDSSSRCWRWGIEACPKGPAKPAVAFPVQVNYASCRLFSH